MGQVGELKGRLEQLTHEHSSFKKRKEAENDELGYQLRETEKKLEKKSFKVDELSQEIKLL